MIIPTSSCSSYQHTAQVKHQYKTGVHQVNTTMSQAGGYITADKIKFTDTGYVCTSRYNLTGSNNTLNFYKVLIKMDVYVHSGPSFNY